MSKLNTAVGANTAISPVQPMRSSRCGQSVGMSMKFDFALRTMFSCRRLSISFEQRNEPVC